MAVGGFGRTVLAIFVGLVLAPVIAAAPGWAREAGWVPIPSESYKPPLKPGASSAKASAKSKAVPKIVNGSTVYDRQPPVTEQELTSFIALLPQFRAWARQSREEAHPIVNAAGQPDFQFSAKAASWVKDHGFDPVRFFCVMGRMAAGLAIIEEGNDMPGARPMDMPSVDQQEVSLCRKHLGELLTAAGAHAN